MSIPSDVGAALVVPAFCFRLQASVHEQHQPALCVRNLHVLSIEASQ